MKTKESIIRKVLATSIWDDNGGLDFGLDSISAMDIVLCMDEYSQQQAANLKKALEAIVKENESFHGLWAKAINSRNLALAALKEVENGK